MRGRTREGDDTLYSESRGYQTRAEIVGCDTRLMPPPTMRCVYALEAGSLMELTGPMQKGCMYMQIMLYDESYHG